MPFSSSRPTLTAVLADETTAQSVTCPMCHTPAALAQSALDAGGEWRCARCGQRWDAGRLATVAAYAAWVVEHDGRAK